MHHQFIIDVRLVKICWILFTITRPNWMSFNKQRKYAAQQTQPKLHHKLNKQNSGSDAPLKLILKAVQTTLISRQNWKSITEYVMEHVSDTFIPLTLKERQTDWYYIVTVITEKVNCSMGSVQQCITTTSVVIATWASTSSSSSSSTVFSLQWLTLSFHNTKVLHQTTGLTPK